LFALRLGDAFKCDEPTLADIYYVTLLRFAGCAADARHRAALFGDEIALGAEIDAVELWKLEPMLAFLHTHGFNRLPPDELQTLLATGVQRSVEAATANCEVGQSIAARLGLGSGVIRALGDVFERWDGGGVPGDASGEQLALPARVATFALDVELYYRLGGEEAVQRLARQRSGGQYDPALVACALARPTLCAGFTTLTPWDEVLALEPGSRPVLAGAQIDAAVRVSADFTDLRTPIMSGHSSAVAELCEAAGLILRLSDSERSALRQAAYVHDVGTVAISVSIWDKPGPLTAGEWERVRLHPYFTERIVARSAAFGAIGHLAALHHEWLDGSGYHRQLRAPLLPITARVLAAAEAYRGMIERRPHRAALSPQQAASELRAQASVGRLDTDAVVAVLEAAGHPVTGTRPARPAGLSAREVEVLGLLAKGMTNKQIAKSLSVAPATIDHHVRHIYNKIGCSTRLAATMFAMEHHLVGEIRPAK
jgi:HD-GYP domain-containing protein (c-di-GMP phosphodiesterase class II)/DNA-binding CsgD family transcriptional regulator